MRDRILPVLGLAVLAWLAAGAGAPALAQNAEEVAAATAATAGLAVPPPPADAKRLAALEQRSAHSITWQPRIEFDRGRLTVAGRSGIVHQSAFEAAGAVSYALADREGRPLPDGVYTYELVFLPAKGGEAEEEGPAPGASGAFRHSGRFTIEGGALKARPLDARLARLATAPEMGSDEPAAPAVFDHVGNFSIDGKLQVGTDETPLDDIHIVSESDEAAAGIYMVNLDSGGAQDGAEWDIDASPTEFAIGQTVLGLASTGSFTIEAEAPGNSLYVADSGNVGVGTSTPSEELSVVDDDNDLEIELSSTATGNQVSLSLVDEEFQIEGNAKQDIVEIDVVAPTDSLAIDADGNVGLGTDAPEKALDIVGHELSTAIQVTNTKTPDAQRLLLQMTNNGATGFQLSDDSNGVEWKFAGLPGGNFEVTKIGSGGFLFRFDQDGDLVLRLGDLVLESGSVIQPSSRDVKEDLEPVDGREALDRILGMPILEWQYIDDERSVRHIGPMAEDFHSGFGVGSSKETLSYSNVSGVALAAIQGLHDVVEEQRTELAERDELIARLEARLSEVEARLGPSAP